MAESPSLRININLIEELKKKQGNAFGLNRKGKCNYSTNRTLSVNGLTCNLYQRVGSYINLGIHEKLKSYHLAQRVVSSPPIQIDRLGRSFTEAPKFVLRILVSEGSKSQTNSRALFPSPVLSPHTRVIYRRLEESYFIFMAFNSNGYQIRLNSNSAIYLRQFSSGFHIDGSALKKIRQKRPFVISRATFLGQGVHSGHWSGDISSTWDDMRYSIPSILNFNLYGVPMVGSDICGFNFNTTVPLCARWQALGAFYPFSRNHNDASAVDQDPAILGPTVIEAATKSLQQRYLILPYLYTLFVRSHIYGDTVARPLFFEYPQDKNTYSIDEQFLLGPAFMVIPVLYEGAVNVTAYFPKGKWCDDRGQLIKSAGEKISLQLPLTDIAIAYRGGYILPLQIPANNTAVSRKNSFVMACTLDENLQANGELYWDDGDSLDSYTNGKYNLIQFSLKNNTLSSTVVNRGYNHSMILNMISIMGTDKSPKTVSVNGRNCSEKLVTKNQGVNLFSPTKISEVLEENKLKDEFCNYIVGDVGFVVVTNIISLLSPFNIVWN
ncbi:Lysosomal alpha-glucosidase [Araneus ventricosus]|uniref:Lysosomal alpha-glucosidase n=1 Tax=Araneus ventricosus TaxID=182803 RepID=A0A4Y2C2D3_ARAVE|nr:Lysosomal alpha-glucosidase [Araneus ventricosus]